MIFKGVKNIEDFFQASFKLIINILIIYIIIILVLGLGKTVYSIKDVFTLEHFAAEFSKVITDILSFLVILELFRSFIEYFKAKRFRLHSMMDPFIIFVVRELIVLLYAGQKVTWQNLAGFAVLIFSLGIVRTLAVMYSPQPEEGTRADTQ